MDDTKWILTIFNDIEDYDSNSMNFITIEHKNKESLLKDISRMIDAKKPIAICEVV